jgi:hypothetical protein
VLSYQNLIYFQSELFIQKIWMSFEKEKEYYME